MTASVLRLEPLDGRTAVEQVKRDLCVADSASSTDTVFELIRAIVWASTAGQMPVSQRVLLDRATEMSASLDDRHEVDRRKCLDAAMWTLEASGDLSYVGRGQWLSSPGFVTETNPESTSHQFLVGGVPLRSLEPSDRQCLVLQGPTRRIETPGPDLFSDLPRVPFHDWARAPASKLTEWTRGMIASPLRRTVKEEVASSVFAFYLPNRSQPQVCQRDRWFTPDEQLHGRFLARETRINGSADYAICELDRGRMIGIRGCTHDDAQRLTFGLDQQYGNATRANWFAMDDHVSRLNLENPLPKAETRRLLGVGGVVVDGAWLIPTGCDEPGAILKELGIEAGSTGLRQRP